MKKEELEAAAAADQGRAAIAGSLLAYLWQRKLWWMIPLTLLLLVAGALVVAAETTALSPFLYTLF